MTILECSIERDDGAEPSLERHRENRHFVLARIEQTPAHFLDPECIHVAGEVSEAELAIDQLAQLLFRDAQAGRQGRDGNARIAVRCVMGHEFLQPLDEFLFPVARNDLCRFDLRCGRRWCPAERRSYRRTYVEHDASKA